MGLPIIHSLEGASLSLSHGQAWCYTCNIPTSRLLCTFAAECRGVDHGRKYFTDIFNGNLSLKKYYLHGIHFHKFVRLLKEPVDSTDGQREATVRLERRQPELLPGSDRFRWLFSSSLVMHSIVVSQSEEKISPSLTYPALLPLSLTDRGEVSSSVTE